MLIRLFRDWHDFSWATFPPESNWTAYVANHYSSGPPIEGGSDPRCDDQSYSDFVRGGTLPLESNWTAYVANHYSSGLPIEDGSDLRCGDQHKDTRCDDQSYSDFVRGGTLPPESNWTARVANHYSSGPPIEDGSDPRCDDQGVDRCRRIIQSTEGAPNISFST